MKWYNKVIEKIKEKLSRKKKVLFFDLDGTLIETKSGKTFPIDKDDWKFKDGVKESLLNYDPQTVLIVSNQGGIEKGQVKDEEFNWKLNEVMININEWFSHIIIPKMATPMGRKPITIYEILVDGIYCPSNDPNNKYRKPNPGMVDYFMKMYGLDKEDCMMVGDASGRKGQFSDSDLKCALNVGIKYMDISDFIKKYI